MLHTLGIHAHSIINLGFNHKSELFYFYSNGTDIVWWLLVVVTSRCAIIIKSVFIHFLFLDNDGMNLNVVVCELGILIKYIFSISYFSSLRLDMFS